MAQRRVLIIDDEEGIRSSLAFFLEDEGYAVRTASGAVEALAAVASDAFDVIVCDVRMPGRDGLDLLPDLVAAQPEATTLVMSAYGAVDQALEAVRRGAWDYLAKPFEPAELLLAIQKAGERERLRRENRRLREELGAGVGSRALIAASGPMRGVFELVERAAEYRTTVLITGESGVGKEVVARTIHELSDRAAQPFLAVNCGAIPESLIESELFGHARGAFTGADSARRGLFREADGGTLFLDEIGELPPAMQVRLLRVLQENEVRPVGEAKAVSVDVRILAATARPLESEIAAERFRADLFYRLDVFRIHVPPLRDRREDIPLLADHLLERIARRLGRDTPRLDTEAAQWLASRDWPGNVRELENALERASILCRGPWLGRQAFATPGELATPAAIAPTADLSSLLGYADAELSSPSLPSLPFLPPIGPRAEGDEDLSIKRQSRQLEERLIRQALVRTGGNRTRAALILEISARALQYKIREYGIHAPSSQSRTERDR